MADTADLTHGRRSRADGRASRERILVTAAQLATVEGIDGLSIGRLAEHIGMSKSGLFAHFGSKEELQLAAIETAEEIFVADVVAPAMAEQPGLGRLEALCERFLSHVGRRVFPGGCFFASVAAELDTRPGPVRERVVTVARGWLDLLCSSVADAQERGQLDATLAPRQLGFELDAFLALGNALFLLDGDEALERARVAIADRIGRARPAGGGDAEPESPRGRAWPRG
jgi:AcrR family transcriptional regulator